LRPVTSDISLASCGRGLRCLHTLSIWRSEGLISNVPHRRLIMLLGVITASGISHKSTVSSAAAVVTVARIHCINLSPLSGWLSRKLAEKPGLRRKLRPALQRSAINCVDRMPVLCCTMSLSWSPETSDFSFWYLSADLRHFSVIIK